MIKRRSYFTNPQIIEMYKKSGYTDERHFAVSYIMEAVGEKHYSYEDFKTAMFYTLCYETDENSSAEVVSEDSEQRIIRLDIGDMHKRYIHLLDSVLEVFDLSGQTLDDDIKSALNDTVSSEDYVFELAVDQYRYFV